MTFLKYIYWQDDDMWLGYLEEYPDYMTQGETIEELQENLRDIQKKGARVELFCNLSKNLSKKIRA
jgi:predicted RNase H-like HicB family nuclease